MSTINHLMTTEQIAYAKKLKNSGFSSDEIFGISASNYRLKQPMFSLCLGKHFIDTYETFEDAAEMRQKLYEEL